MKNKKQKLGTKDLFLRTLTEMGCQYEIDEEIDNCIIFGYQGEMFHSLVYNDKPYVWIRGPYWMIISQDDIDEMARLRRVINDANKSNLITTVYTLYDDDKSFCIHSQLSFSFFSQCPNLIGYLRAQLDAFFQTKHFIQIELEKLRQKDGVE